MSARKDLVELFEGRPGWRLEARPTPGAAPLWCYVSDGEIEYSVVAEGGVIRLYVMATDRELVFRDADELTAWIRANHDAALSERTQRPEGRDRFRRLFEWG